MMNLPRLTSPTSVLVVDDNATNRLVLSAMCELLGARVTTACGGAEAVDVCAAAAFDVVLMDIRMPGVDGFGASAAIRALPSPAGDTPIIAVTGEQAEDLQARCRRVGIREVVEKPVAIRALAEAIERGLSEAARDSVEKPPIRPAQAS